LAPFLIVLLRELKELAEANGYSETKRLKWSYGVLEGA